MNNIAESDYSSSDDDDEDDDVKVELQPSEYRQTLQSIGIAFSKCATTGLDNLAYTMSNPTTIFSIDAQKFMEKQDAEKKAIRDKAIEDAKSYAKEHEEQLKVILSNEDLYDELSKIPLEDLREQIFIGIENDESNKAFVRARMVDRLIYAGFSIDEVKVILSKLKRLSYTVDEVLKMSLDRIVQIVERNIPNGEPDKNPQGIPYPDPFFTFKVSTWNGSSSDTDNAIRLVLCPYPLHGMVEFIRKDENGKPIRMSNGTYVYDVLPENSKEAKERKAKGEKSQPAFKRWSKSDKEATNDMLNKVKFRFLYPDFPDYPANDLSKPGDSNDFIRVDNDESTSTLEKNAPHEKSVYNCQDPGAVPQMIDDEFDPKYVRYRQDIHKLIDDRKAILAGQKDIFEPLVYDKTWHTMAGTGKGKFRAPTKNVSDDGSKTDSIVTLTVEKEVYDRLNEISKDFPKMSQEEFNRFIKRLDRRLIAYFSPFFVKSQNNDDENKGIGHSWLQRDPNTNKIKKISLTPDDICEMIMFGRVKPNANLRLYKFFDYNQHKWVVSSTKPDSMYVDEKTGEQKRREIVELGQESDAKIQEDTDGYLLDKNGNMLKQHYPNARAFLKDLISWIDGGGQELVFNDDGTITKTKSDLMTNAAAKNECKFLVKQLFGKKFLDITSDKLISGDFGSTNQDMTSLFFNSTTQTNIKNFNTYQNAVVSAFVKALFKIGLSANDSIINKIIIDDDYNNIKEQFFRTATYDDLRRLGLIFIADSDSNADKSIDNSKFGIVPYSIDVGQKIFLKFEQYIQKNGIVDSNGKVHRISWPLFCDFILNKRNTKRSQKIKTMFDDMLDDDDCQKILQRAFNELQERGKVCRDKSEGNASEYNSAGETYSFDASVQFGENANEIIECITNANPEKPGYRNKERIKRITLIVNAIFDMQNIFYGEYDPSIKDDDNVVRIYDAIDDSNAQIYDSDYIRTVSTKETLQNRIKNKNILQGLLIDVLMNDEKNKKFKLQLSKNMNAIYDDPEIKKLIPALDVTSIEAASASSIYSLLRYGQTIKPLQKLGANATKQQKDEYEKAKAIIENDKQFMSNPNDTRLVRIIKYRIKRDLLNGHHIQCPQVDTISKKIKERNSYIEQNS